MSYALAGGGSRHAHQFASMVLVITKGQTVNEEQKQWMETIKKIVADAETSGANNSYELAVDRIQLAVDQSPEP